MEHRRMKVLKSPASKNASRTEAQWRGAFAKAKAEGMVRTVLSFPGAPDLGMRPIAKPAHPPTSVTSKQIRKAVRAVVADEAKAKPRKRKKCQMVHIDIETRSAASLSDKPVLAMLDRGRVTMVDLEPAALGDRTRPWQYMIADYEVRADKHGTWGIYLRRYNVRVATFAADSHALRSALDRMFTAAHTLKESAKKAFKAERGWYTHGCGQWVHDEHAPCSVCPKPKRRKR
jgi:hypothetical protein